MGLASSEVLGLALDSACIFYAKLKYFVAVQIGATGALPAEMAIEAIGTDCWIRRAAKEEPAVASASQISDNELQQALAQALALFLRKQGQDDNFSGPRGAKAVADQLTVTSSYPSRQLASLDVFGPGLSSNAVSAQPFF